MSKSQYFFLNGQKYFIDSELTILEIIKYFNYNTSLLFFLSVLYLGLTMFSSVNAVSRVEWSLPPGHISDLRHRDWLNLRSRERRVSKIRKLRWGVNDCEGCNCLSGKIVKLIREVGEPDIVYRYQGSRNVKMTTEFTSPSGVRRERLGKWKNWSKVKLLKTFKQLTMSNRGSQFT